MMQSCFAKSYFHPSPEEEIQYNANIPRQEDTQAFPKNSETCFTTKAHRKHESKFKGIQKYNKPKKRVKLKRFFCVFFF